MKRPCSVFNKFLRGSDGVGMIEFAIALPILILLFAGVIELTRYVLVHQKIDKSANSLADYLGQQENPATFQIAPLDEAFDKLLEPFSANTAGYILTGVGVDTKGTATKSDDTYSILWRKTRGSIGTSRVGPAVGAPANINGIELTEGEVAISAEVYYEHHSILDSAGSISEALDFNGENLYKQAISLQRVPPEPPTGTAQPMTNLYGCCGEWCNEGDPLDPYDTDWLPSCACLGYSQCRPGTMSPRQQLLESHYGCQFTNCPANPNPKPPYCSLPQNADKCACNPANCKTGGV